MRPEDKKLLDTWEEFSLGDKAEIILGTYGVGIFIYGLINWLRVKRWLEQRKEVRERAAISK